MHACVVSRKMWRQCSRAKCGAVRLIDNLLQGKWDEKEYLIVPPANAIEGVYDWDQVVRAMRI